MYSRKETVVLAIQEILNLICIAILYSIISLTSCFGIIFLIFLKYVKTTYSLAKQTRLKLEKEEVQLLSLSDKITKCSESLERIPEIIHSTQNGWHHTSLSVMNSATMNVPHQRDPPLNHVSGTTPPLCISNKNIETLARSNNKRY